MVNPWTALLIGLWLSLVFITFCDIVAERKDGRTYDINNVCEALAVATVPILSMVYWIMRERKKSGWWHDIYNINNKGE